MASDVKQLTTAAAGIAELLEPLTPDQRQKAIDAAQVLIKPARAQRSDKGRKRKTEEKHSSNCGIASGLLCDCEKR